MKRLALLLIVALVACTPTLSSSTRATITAQGHTLSLESDLPVTSAKIAVKGEMLKLISDYCRNRESNLCAEQDGWVYLSLPERASPYGRVTELGSYQGRVIDAVAVINPVGENESWCVVLRGAKPCKN